MAVFMAMYSEYFYSNEHKLLRLLRLPHTYLKYQFSTKRLSRRTVELFENSDSDFYNSLFQLGDTRIYKTYQAITEHKVKVNKVFEIPTKALQIISEDSKKLVNILIPTCFVGSKPIACRLLSARRRKGMVSLSF